MFNNIYPASEIVNTIKDRGIAILPNVLSPGLIQSIIRAVNLVRPRYFDNCIQGVYLSKGQFFHSHLTAISSDFNSFLLSSFVHTICSSYFGSNTPYRLKCHRYYENYGWYGGQKWHIDNKSDGNKILPSNKGLIFLSYFSDNVLDGAFEYVAKSHGVSGSLSDTVIDDAFVDLQFPGMRGSVPGNLGDLIVYDTSLIHRAGAMTNLSSNRSALFLQIDTDMSNGEPIFVNPSLIPSSSGLSPENIFTFLGFGNSCFTTSFPSSNIQEQKSFFLKQSMIARGEPVPRHPRT